MIQRDKKNKQHLSEGHSLQGIYLLLEKKKQMTYLASSGEKEIAVKLFNNTTIVNIFPEI
jgi:hypothetical protein